MVEAAAEGTKAAKAAEDTKVALTTTTVSKSAKDPRWQIHFTKKGGQELSQNGRNDLRTSLTSQEGDGLPQENGTIQIQSAGADIVTRMGTTQEERLTIAQIVRNLEEKGQQKAMIIRLYLAPTEQEVASNSNRCEKGQGQTMCYIQRRR